MKQASAFEFVEIYLKQNPLPQLVHLHLPISSQPTVVAAIDTNNFKHRQSLRPERESFSFFIFC